MSLGKGLHDPKIVAQGIGVQFYRESSPSPKQKPRGCRKQPAQVYPCINSLHQHDLLYKCIEPKIKQNILASPLQPLLPSHRHWMSPGHYLSHKEANTTADKNVYGVGCYDSFLNLIRINKNMQTKFLLRSAAAILTQTAEQAKYNFEAQV